MGDQLVAEPSRQTISLACPLPLVQLSCMERHVISVMFNPEAWVVGLAACKDIRVAKRKFKVSNAFFKWMFFLTKMKYIVQSCIGNAFFYKKMIMFGLEREQWTYKALVTQSHWKQKKDLGICNVQDLFGV